MNYENLLTRGVSEIITKSELEEKLRENKKLRLKQGFDPSNPNLHIGHAIGLKKLREFQELGHRVILIVGDWTAQIGDPSGREETRKMLSEEEVQKNATTYMEQFFRIVDKTKTEIRWQSEWFSKFSLKDIFNLTRQFTLAQIMAHETFKNRYNKGLPLTLMEIIYPLLQAYDSVIIKSDVEFGGTDQKFNILAGRELQTQLGYTPQVAFLLPLLIGTDGRKMSKTFNNTIDLNDNPADMYGKVMSLKDELIINYFTLLTDLPLKEIDEIKIAMEKENLNPRDAKMKLAKEIVTILYNKELAIEAEQKFIKVFQKREVPDEIQTFQATPQMNLIDIMVLSSLSPSRSEAKRLIKQGAVEINNKKIIYEDLKMLNEQSFQEPIILKVGKRRFLKIIYK